MTHEIVRCKHCGTEYSHQMSGYGCFDSLNNKEYCPNCMKAINDALSKIYVKYVPQYKYINSDIDFYNDKLLPLKEKFNDERKFWPVVSKMISFEKKTNKSIIECYYYKNNEYIIEKYDDKIDIYRLTEFSVGEQDFTNKPWMVESEDRYQSVYSLTSMINMLKDNICDSNKQFGIGYDNNDVFEWTIECAKNIKDKEKEFDNGNN